MRRKISAEIWDQVKTAFAAGLGLREIGRKMNIPEGTVLAYAKRHGWTSQILAVRQQSDGQSNPITPAEAAANIISERKDKSRLHLSKYVVDASRTAAKSNGDLKITRNVKDVAAIHSTIWPEESQRGSGVLPPLWVYSDKTIVAVETKTDSQSVK